MTQRTQQLNGLNNSETVINALSVDVEEYYHATIFQAAAPRFSPQALESRVVPATNRILNLLAAHGVRGTFFVLGEVAAAHPDLVRQVAAAGHEIGCHGYYHNLVYTLTPDQFRSDVLRAKCLLEDLTSMPVLGYRAPTYSIPASAVWAYEILLELGFRYDSSIYPIVHDLYGQPNSPRFPYDIYSNGEKKLVEFPIGTMELLGSNLPIGGGGYFRLLPVRLIRRGIAWVNHREGAPVMFFVHPWELDPHNSLPPMAWRDRFRLTVGLASSGRKLSYLLRTTLFAPVKQILGLHEERSDLSPTRHNG